MLPPHRARINAMGLTMRSVTVRYLPFLICLIGILATYYWLMERYDVKTAMMALGGFLLACVVIGIVRRLVRKLR